MRIARPLGPYPRPDNNKLPFGIENDPCSELLTFPIQCLLDLERIFVAARSANALVVADDAEFTAQRVEIAELALRNRLPSVSGLRELAEAGGLMAYGASFGDLYRRAASHVSKILQGAKASDLPIEQPVKFEFVLNMRTAKLLGLSIPPSLLALADEVIE